MEVYVGEFEIGGSTGSDQYKHGDAHEMLVVLRGVVEVSLGEARHVLEEGDAVALCLALVGLAAAGVVAYGRRRSRAV